MINMYNDAIANPIYEVDPNISDEVFMAWEPAIHGSWEQFVKSYNLNIASHNLKIKDLVASENQLVTGEEGVEYNHLSMRLFNTPRTQLSQPLAEQENDINSSDFRVEDPDLLHDDGLPQYQLREAQAAFNVALNPVQSSALKLSKGRFFSKTNDLRNHHLIKLITPESSYDGITSAPSFVGMMNSMPVVPHLILPQSEIRSPRRTVKTVKGYMASMSIDAINQKLVQIPFGPYPIKHYDGYGDYDDLRADLVVSFSQQYNMGLVIRPIRLGKRTSLPVFIERINFDLQTCLYRIKSEFKGVIYYKYPPSLLLCGIGKEVH